MEGCKKDILKLKCSIGTIIFSLISIFYFCSFGVFFSLKKISYAKFIFKIREEGEKLDEPETALNDRFPLTLTAACKTDLRNKVRKKGQSDFDSEPKLL